MLKCDATDRHLHKRLWLRSTCLESVFVGQDFHILMEEMGSLSVYCACSCLKHRQLFSVQCLTSMFVLLRAKRGGLYFFRITLFCVWKSQFQSTFSSLFLTPSGLTWLLALPQWHLSSPCRNMRVDDVPKPSHGPPSRNARRPPTSTWIELDVSALGGCLWDNVLCRWCVWATPPTTNKASIIRSQQIRMPWEFSPVLFVASMSALSVSP